SRSCGRAVNPGYTATDRAIENSFNAPIWTISSPDADAPETRVLCAIWTSSRKRTPALEPPSGRGCCPHEPPLGQTKGTAMSKNRIVTGGSRTYQYVQAPERRIDFI